MQSRLDNGQVKKPGAVKPPASRREENAQEGHPIAPTPARDNTSPRLPIRGFMEGASRARSV